MIAVDSLEQVLEAPSAVGGAAQDSSRNYYATLEDEVPTREVPSVDNAYIEASLVEVTNASPLWAKQGRFMVDGAWKPPDMLVLSSYVEPVEWARPTEDASAPDQETTRALINYRRPLDRRDPSVLHMRDLYPHNFLVSAMAHGEEYSIPFHVNLDKRSYQRVAEGGMYMRNHDFDETTELVWLNL